MPVKVSRGPVDTTVKAIRDCLRKYLRDHPGADVELYRQNSVSIRVRVVEERFASMGLADRHADVWRYLNDRLPDDVMQEISVLLTVTPDEAKRNIGSLDFDDPIPSRL